MLRTTSLALALSLTLLSAGPLPASANISDGTSSETQIQDKADITKETPREGTESRVALPLPISRALEQGMVLKSRFKAASGLTGWVLSLDDQFTLVYTTPDQRTLISGALINEAGDNLSEEYARQYFPKPDISLLADSTYISVGAPDTPDLPDSASAPVADKQAAQETDTDTESDNEQAETEADKDAPVVQQPQPHRIVYAFFDPACPFCHLAWKAFQPYIAKGVEVRWIPVAFLNPDSRTKAAAILQSATPARQLDKSMTHFDTDQQPETAVKETARRQLQHNMKLMQRFGIQGTPGFVWLDDSDKVQIRSGMPDLHEFAEITDLPEQPQTDPELFRFR